MEENDKILATGVAISLFVPSDSDWSELWPSAVERRTLQRDIEDEKAMLIACQLFVEIIERGQLNRVGGTKWGPSIIRLDSDPTADLVAAAYEGRMHMGDLYGDLIGTQFPIRKWDLHAAPFRPELGHDVRARVCSVLRS